MNTTANELRAVLKMKIAEQTNEMLFDMLDDVEELRAIADIVVDERATLTTVYAAIVVELNSRMTDEQDAIFDAMFDEPDYNYKGADQYRKAMAA